MQFKAEKNKSEEHPQYSTENGKVVFHIFQLQKLYYLFIFTYDIMYFGIFIICNVQILDYIS